MSPACALTKCERTARGLCDCCQQNLCLQHLNEHNASLLSQLSPLTDAINILGERLDRLNRQKPIDHYRQKLEQWRSECYREIDRIFELKCQQLGKFLEEKIESQKNDLNCVQSRVAELTRVQETTQRDLNLLKSTVQQLEQRMQNIEQPSLDIVARRCEIDETFVTIKDSTEQMVDLSALADACKTRPRPFGSYVALACNEQYVLTHQKPHLRLLDREMNVVKQTIWPFDRIYDVCWSKTLDKFIVIQIQTIHLVDKNTLVTETMQTISDGNLESCTCSDTSLFLSTCDPSSSIQQYSLLPSVQCIKQWKTPHTCSSDERIHDIVHGDETLALLIRHSIEQSTRLELRTVQTLDHIWSFRPDSSPANAPVFRCCSLAYKEWLLADRLNGQLLHISKDGKMKNTTSYHPNPHRVVLFKPNMLVVATKTQINFHHLQTITVNTAGT